MSNEATPLLRNHAKEKLAKGEPVYSMTVRLVRTVDIASIAYTAGFDSIYIDMEHSTFPLEAAGQICMACNHLGVTPLVRVPGLDPAFIARVMDSGAMGIIVPGVQSADEARAAVRAVKHVPLGERSLAGAAPQLHYRSLPADQTIRELDATSMVVADDRIPGRSGRGGRHRRGGRRRHAARRRERPQRRAGDRGADGRPRMHEAYLHVIEVCRAHGKAVGIGGIGGRPDLIRSTWTSAPATSPPATTSRSSSAPPQHRSVSNSTDHHTTSQGRHR